MHLLCCQRWNLTICLVPGPSEEMRDPAGPECSRNTRRVKDSDLTIKT
jgi:hypothetical protein